MPICHGRLPFFPHLHATRHNQGQSLTIIRFFFILQACTIVLLLLLPSHIRVRTEYLQDGQRLLLLCIANKPAQVLVDGSKLLPKGKERRQINSNDDGQQGQGPLGRED